MSFFVGKLCEKMTLLDLSVGELLDRIFTSCDPTGESGKSGVDCSYGRFIGIISILEIGQAGLRLLNCLHGC